MKILTVILSLFILSSCGKDITLNTENKGLVVTAIVHVAPLKLNEKKFKIEGNVSIKNTTTSEILYSNKELYIVSSGSESRTYKDSIASNTVDFSAISIAPNSTFQQKVYWVFEAGVEANEKAIRLELRK